MQTFTIGVGHRWWTQVFRRNPLVRPSDRIEVLVLGFAVLLTVVAIPVAGAIGTFVHDARTRVYAEEAQTTTSGDRDRHRRRHSRHATEEPFVHSAGHVECGRT